MVGKKNRFVSSVLRLAPYKLVRHYIYPFLIRAERSSYQADVFWESYHQAARAEELSDRATVAHDADPWYARFYYNSIENLIVRFVADYDLRLDDAEILDVGSGAGHWIDYFRCLTDGSHVVGTDLSRAAVDVLHKKYANDPNVEIRRHDIARAEPLATDCFDVINAIGIMSHIVEDPIWRDALRNIERMLKPSGYCIVSGHFGLISRAIQFHNRDEFTRWSEYTSLVSPTELLELSRRNHVLINKRIRSVHRWKKTAAEVGLKCVRVYRNRTPRPLVVPEGNIMILRRSGG